jgi:hypothetical protein
MAQGEAAPEVPRRMSDEFEWLKAERVVESAGWGLDPPN